MEPHGQQPVAEPVFEACSARSTYSRDQGLFRDELEQLERSFQQSFSVADVTTGEIVRVASDGLNLDLYPRLGLCEHVVRRGRPEIIEDVAPLLLLAIPLLSSGQESHLVAVATFVSQPVETEAAVAAAARSFGVDARHALEWAQVHQSWPPFALIQLAQTLSDNTVARDEIDRLRGKVRDVSGQLLATFDEITLLHRLTLHLSLSGSVSDLYRLAAEWLAEVVPADCLAIKLAVDRKERDQEVGDNVGEMLIAHGELPVSEAELDALIELMKPEICCQSVVMNSDKTAHPTWPTDQVKQFISVPIREGERLFGWLLALNHNGACRTTLRESEFGTVESSLMTSVAVILGIHGGNIELYQEQSELFASVVRALTSSIDAKDPYTYGHSDRVARLSVCLARQLGCSNEDLNTIYLSGLLHDIGKIGIDDHVLRKPGALTPEEYDQIKTHPELGHRILQGIKQLDKVLPIVLHHHEAWDGRGYPHGLVGKDCPRLARIVAVADSIDAMSSDRPYRTGMPEEQLDRILQEGAGKQWDADVIDAVFAVRDEIRRIGQEDRHPLSLDVRTWQHH